MSTSKSPDGKCPKCGAPMAAETTEGLCPACLLALNLMTQTQLTGEGSGTYAPSKAPPPPQAPPVPEEIAPFFPHFEILQCLGRGGMGVVYRARQKSLNRMVALKILAPEREKDAAFSERFAAEAETLAKLNHPNIITVHDFGETHEMFFLVMEFVDGVNLRQLLRERKLAPEEALAIVPPVCDAIQYAHSQGVVHRDIKPENLLLDKQGRIKIADFGIARILGRTSRPAPSGEGLSGSAPSASAEGGTQDQVIGTPHYMAPEQTASPQVVDHRADIYSLGVVLYEMLTGELPSVRLQPPSRTVQMDVRIDEIVLRALEQEPEKRYQTAEQFKAVVETISVNAANSSSQSSSPKGEPVSDAAGANPRRDAIFVGATIFTLLVLTAIDSAMAMFIGALVLLIAGLGWVYRRSFRLALLVALASAGVAAWAAVIFVTTRGSSPSSEFGGRGRVLLPLKDRTDASARRLPGDGPEEVLSMSGLRLSEADLITIASKTNLKRLHLNDSSIRVDDLAKLSGLTDLEWVDLSASLGSPPFKPGITDAGLEHVARWKKLKVLNLHGLPITDEGLKHLWYLPELRRLQLGGTRVTGKPLGRIHSLTWLRLDATPIQDEDLRSLGGLRNLEQLYLDLTDVSNAGLPHLTGLTNLNVLNLHSTKVTADGVAFLKEHLPGLAIGWEAETPSSSF